MLASGARCGTGMRTSRSAAIATLGLALIGGCGDAGPTATPNDPAPTTEPSDTSTVTTGATTGASSTTPASPTTAGSVPDAVPDATSGPTGITIGFDELLDAPDDLIDRPFRVAVRAFFVEQCPPPGTTPAAPCSLSLFVTEPERDHLVYADRTNAIPVFDDAGRVSCQVGGGVTTACPGWTHAALYELTGTAERSSAAPGIELHVTDARLLDEASARRTSSHDRARQLDDRPSARPMPDETTRR